MKKKTYTFVIPHHNTPDLLCRCVNSIPQRDDIEIIVVDDNSDEDKKASISREDVKIISIGKENTRGAGHARNEGMAEAKGKWILFADADDFYKDGFLAYLDDYSNSDNEVIYFTAGSVDSNTLKPIKRNHTQKMIIMSFDGSPESVDAVKYKTHTPWNKMTNREFILRNHICFEEVPQGNDTMFSYLVGYFARNIAVIKQELYVYSHTLNSITTRKKNKDLYLVGLENYYKQRTFLKYVGRPEYTLDLLHYFCRCYKQYGFRNMIKIINLFFVHNKYIKSQASYYVKLTNNGTK